MTSEVEHGGYPRYHPTPLRRSCGILVRCWRRTTSLFPPPPAPPSSTTALGCGGLLTLTLRGKAMDGFEEQQERNRPQLSPPSLETRRTDAGFPQASTGRRRSVAWRSLGLSLHHERNIQSTGVRRRQHNQPVHQIGADSLAITSAKRRVRNLAEETANRRRPHRFGSHRGTAIRVASS